MNVLGCRVDLISQRQAIATICDLAAGPGPSLVVTLGTEMVVWAQRDAEFRRVVNASALSLCDTIGVALAARLRGARIVERIAGVDLIDPLCAALASAGHAVYFLGARGQTAASAAAVVRARHPGLVVAGARDGYFSAEQNAAIAAQIAASGARVLFVGLGSPRQELWIANNLAATGARVGIGVGGSFDVLAGNVKRAPLGWRRLRLEWFYRLLREPSRFRRQLALPYFVWLALCDRFRSHPEVS